MFWYLIVLVLAWYWVGYRAGRERGREEGRNVTFTPVDDETKGLQYVEPAIFKAVRAALKPGSGYDSQPHYSPGLAPTRARRIHQILRENHVCFDCSKPLKDKDIFRRPLHIEGVDETALEVVCFDCLINQDGKGV